uniref:Uncharacterized protein n=1 Tax=Oncorhynchus tshawytscha TaxID=74940 RepID=A0A8C8H9F2_ONCTS
MSVRKVNPHAVPKTRILVYKAQTSYNVSNLCYIRAYHYNFLHMLSEVIGPYQPFVLLPVSPVSITLKPDSSVELFYLHAADHQNPIQDTLQACHELHDGKYKELGLPNYIASEVAGIATICKQLDTSHCLSGNTHRKPASVTHHILTFTLDTIKHYLWMIHVFYVRYWKECHSQDIELVQKTPETVYGSDKQTMTYAALHWMDLGYSVIIGMSCVEQLQQNPFEPPEPMVI